VARSNGSSGSAILCVSGSANARSVSPSTAGCSWISFSMKCRWLPLPISAPESAVSLTGRSTARPSASTISAPARVTKATSPSSMYWTREVSGANASASEPTNISPSPYPTASGLPFRAATSRSSRPSNTIANANAPLSSRTAASTASRGPSPRAICRLTRCGTTSVSVCVSNRLPRATSPARSS
jgi:hypothetical protein